MRYTKNRKYRDFVYEAEEISDLRPKTPVKKAILLNKRRSIIQKIFDLFKGK